MRDYEVKNAKVYCRGSLLRAADSSTFREINELYSCDCRHVYVLGSVLQEADPVTFVAFPPHLTWHKNGEEEYFIGSGYGRDTAHVFFYEYTVGKGFIVKGADPVTFEVLEHEFARDAKHVYAMGRKVVGGRPTDVKILSRGYLLSNNKVFYGNTVLTEADTRTFQACKDRLNLGVLAKDEHRHYDAGRIVDLETFNKYLVE